MLTATIENGQLHVAGSFTFNGATQSLDERVTLLPDEQQALVYVPGATPLYQMRAKGKEAGADAVGLAIVHRKEDGTLDTRAADVDAQESQRQKIQAMVAKQDAARPRAPTKIAKPFASLTPAEKDDLLRQVAVRLGFLDDTGSAPAGGSNPQGGGKP